MIFQWRWILILPALLLGGEISFAASVAKEQRDFAAAIGAFNDGMYPRAETGFDQFKKNYPASTNAPMAVLLEAQAQFKQGEFTNAIALLNDTTNLAKAGNLADQYFYWTAESRFTNGDFSAAADTFVSLAQKFPESPLRLSSVVEAASAYERMTNWAAINLLLEDASGVFQRAAQTDPGSELVLRGRLLLAQAKSAQKDFAGEFEVLTSLDSQTLKPELGWQRAYLLNQNRLAAGDLEAALAVTTNLLQIARLENDGGLIAESMAARAETLEQMGRAAEAMAAYQENLGTNVPVEMQREAALKVAELAMAQNQFTNAEQLPEKFLAQFADIALLTSGELHLKSFAAQPSATEQLQMARTNFDQFIGAFTNSPLLGKAYLDRGWCGWLAGKFPESLDDFRAAAERLPPSEDLAVAKFKLGDAQLQQNDFAGALENYHSVLDDFTNFPTVGQTLGGLAQFQRLHADLELTNLDDANAALGQVLKFYSGSGLADDGILLFGEKLTDLRQPATARTILEKYREMNLTSPLRPQIDLAVARTYEQQQNWTSAIGQYETWLNDFPANELRPQVEYARAWANFEAGDETNAFAQFTNFVAEFPADELAPQAQWWVADHFFRAGEWADAEKNYAAVFQNTNWQGSPLENRTNLFYPAQLMAGRAAMGWLGYSDAIHYFTGLTGDTNCPPDLNAQALFAYGSALMIKPSDDTNNPLANFKLAASVFGQIGQTNELGAQAQIEIGKCDLQLANYDDATNAYATVFNSTNADISSRSEAQIGFGIALEKKAALATGDSQNALIKTAHDKYYDVFKGNNLIRDKDETPDPFWQKKAALEAERLAEYFQQWKTAFAYYRDMTNNWPSLQAPLENKMEILVRDHPEAAQK
jgi:TolA-binding protein